MMRFGEAMARASVLLIALPFFAPAWAQPGLAALRDAESVVFRAAIERARASIVRIDTIGGAQPGQSSPQTPPRLSVRQCPTRQQSPATQTQEMTEQRLSHPP